jgi:hypothetical protein
MQYPSTPRFSLVCLLPLALAACSSASGGVPAPDGDPTGAVPQGQKGRLRCDLTTAYGGDAECILPPDPDEGIQIHLGPADYDDPDSVAPFMIAAGDENVECHYQQLDNDALHFYDQYYRMRPGSHHLFVNLTNSDKEGWVPESGCDPNALLVGGSQRSEYDFPTGGVKPPEDEDLGRPLGAQAKIMLQAHFVNVTDDPLLREAWVNLMKVTGTDTPRLLGGITMFGGVMKSFAPGTRTTTDYSCENKHEGRRVVSLFGHRHAHSTRFTAWLEHAGGDRELLYEDYDWHEPTELMFNSVTTNPLPDPVKKAPGGASGLLVLSAGDKLDWECEINNDSNNTLTFSNEVFKGEMCNVFGSIVATDGAATWTCIPEAQVNN